MGFAHSAGTGAGDGGGGGWGLIAKACDYCNSAQALLFCRTDSTYMCMLCDSKIHVTSKLGLRHERVWMCEVCEQAPASLTCKADAATLCVTCDRDIHIASPLAQRHERLPVVPFYDTAESVVKSSASGFDINNTCESHDDVGSGGYNMIDQWKVETAGGGSEDKSIDFIFSDTDNQLDFDFPETRFEQKLSCVNDGVVPDHQIKHSGLRNQLQIPSEKHMEIDFTKSLVVNPYHHFTQSLSQSVSSSSMEIGVVPEGSSMSEISYPLGINNVDFGGNQVVGGGGGGGGAQLAVGMDREARVLRYREKRKNRKFEKTIRYASRKAYAETRPRIKGRFAKRSEADHDHSTDDDIVHQRLFTSDDFFPESRYGVVPSF